MPTKSGSGVVTDTFSQVTARYVRIIVTGNTANTAAHIEEIKIYQSTSTSTSTSTPSPVLPTPTNSPTPTSMPSGSTNSLPLTGLGADYVVYLNHDPSVWDSQLHFFTQFHSNTARLMFSFKDDLGPTSTYSYSKMSAVLDKLNSVGVKAVICDFPGDDSHFYGSQAWINDWRQVAADFKGDSRIAAFEIANEPYPGYMAPNANTMHTFNVACSNLIDQIRSIDPSRTIMYPVELNLLTNDINALYNDLVSTGVTSKGNILYDIVHPYFFQEPSMDGTTSPVDRADWLWFSIVLPQIEKFGAENCWCGETFAWPRGPNGGASGAVNIDYNLQQIFERRMINYFVQAGIGFQMLSFFTTSDQQAQIDALVNSQYYILIHS